MCNEGLISHFKIGSSAPVFSNIFSGGSEENHEAPKPRLLPCHEPNPKHSLAANLIRSNHRQKQWWGSLRTFHQYPFTKNAGNFTSNTRTEIDKHFM
jgi:hypothetical protein